MADFTATEVLDTLMKNLKDILTTKSIVGEPIQAGSATVIPVMKVSLGFGAGGGMAKTQQGSGGGGGGISITPVGFLVIQDGKATMITGSNQSKWEWIADSIPDIIERLTKIRQTAKSEKDSRPGESSKE